MIKILGALLIMIGCGSVGFKMAAGYIREERCLKQIISTLDYMECELQYRLMALPELCMRAAENCGGKLKLLLYSLIHEMEAQISPDAERCMSAALSKHRDLPPISTEILEKFGHSLGKFDLQGQLKGINDIRSECKYHLDQLLSNKEQRLKAYRTLALCAGAALAILFF